MARVYYGPFTNGAAAWNLQIPRGNIPGVNHVFLKEVFPGGDFRLKRVTVIADVHVKGERKAVKAWLARWRHTFKGEPENSGCGCCVDIYDLTVTDEAIADLPEHFFAGSDWSEL